ncbi:condensation domain-containing protein [Asticcacaulis sp. SL142]|uniref:condensation domain-containing protein n=1 Tax=Asticcacaulis sp. SL142 TaxID=2995155 RepID=UPI00226D39A8|nr:condensation domain-containing protein [Asticcacaulis sp. SL142]WAC49750.1 condensation domain-containing protein [Asticcacaulis sp. SL142]
MDEIKGDIHSTLSIPTFVAGPSGPVRSFCLAAWGGLKDGVTKPDSTNKPNGMLRVRFLRLGALQQAVRQLVKRHTILNCRIVERDNAPWLVPLEGTEPRLQFLDCSNLDRESAEQAISEIVWTPFDIATGPLLKVFAVKRDTDEYYVGLVAHHFVADAVSAGILLSEIVALHRALARHQPPKLSPVRLKYEDYLRGINMWVETREGQNARISVINRLRDSVVADFTAITSGLEAAGDYFEVDSDVSEAVRAAARNLGTSPFVVLLTAQNILNAPFSDGINSMLKVITTGREIGDLARIVGNLADRIFVSTSLPKDTSFSEAVLRTHAAVSLSRKTAFVRSDFQLIDLSHNKISAQAPVFNFRTLPSEASRATPFKVDEQFVPLRIRPYANDKRTAPRDAYYLEIFDNGEALWGSMRYGRGRILGYLQAFEDVLRSGCSAPQIQISRFDDYLVHHAKTPA